MALLSSYELSTSSDDRTRKFSLKKVERKLTKCIRSWFAPRPGVPYGPSAINDCHCCCERKLLKVFTLECSRQGVPLSKLPHWIHRKYGDFVIQRTLFSGSLGTSIPCVICRKALDRMSIQWRAHIGDEWFKSNDSPPKSRPTHKQKHKLNFRG